MSLIVKNFSKLSKCSFAAASVTNFVRNSSGEGHWTRDDNYGPEWDKRWADYFNNPQLSTTAMKKGLNDLYCHDVVPHPIIIEAVFRACRRLDDFPTPTRLMEAVSEVVEKKADYDWIVEKMRPTIDELGILFPEDLGIHVTDKGC